MDPEFLDTESEHEHDDRVTSTSCKFEGSLNVNKLENWIGELLEEHSQNLFRYKGVLAVKGMDKKFVFQGVHMLMDASPMGPWPAGKDRSSRVVFIGRNLETMNLQEGFEGCKVA